MNNPNTPTVETVLFGLLYGFGIGLVLAMIFLHINVAMPGEVTNLGSHTGPA